ncbi:DUF4334 domain-containing protein [Nocardia sp. CWNU-33]|uniref:DUF4334 domain-containing protein n=1 Tax=Nocardia sp. CWNU-33 TaxID=3392117 RepID=UPI00398F5FC8
MAETRTAAPGTAELAALQAGGCTPQQAWELFDRLPGVPTAEITTGRWRGEELDTRHPFAGVLVASGWYGKQFDTADAVHPLLFADETGTVFPVDPRRVPLGLAGRVPLVGVRMARKSLRVIGSVLRTRTPAARLRDIEYRGVLSAGMIYDHLPIIDHFRRVDERTLLGVMDLRGMTEPYFFVLRRETV